MTPYSFTWWPWGSPSCRCPGWRCQLWALPAAQLQSHTGNGSSSDISSPGHPGHHQSQGSSGHPSTGTAGSALAQVVAGQPLADPCAVTHCIPCSQGLGRTIPPAAPHGSALASTYLPLGQTKPDTRTSCPPGLSPVSFPSPLITPGSFLPGNPESHSLAMPPPHQLPSIVLPGGPTNYTVPSLRDCSLRPCWGYMAGSTRPKPLPAGPAPLPKSALAAGLMTLNCW